MSQITIVGNLVADPEVLLGAGDKTSMARFRVAVTTRKYNAAERKWEDGEPVFWKCVAFSKLAEQIKLLSKGQRVIVLGDVRESSWVDKDSGVKRTEKEIIASEAGESVLFRKNLKATVSQTYSEDPNPTWATGDTVPF